MSDVVDWPAASTRPVVLLGDPVDHSLSPRIHNTVFRALRLDLVYLALPTRSQDVPIVLDALGAVGALGANVTVPHKLLVHDLCDRLSEEARLLGAVNTVSWDGEVMVGTNTDATGLGRVLDDTVGDLGGDAVVVLGTGGAARAAVVAAARRGARVTVAGRRPDAAATLAALAERAGGTGGHCGLDGARLEGAVSDARVVVNATPLGMAGERLPAPFHSLRPGQVAHDLVYGHGRTAFVADAEAVGVDAHDGRAMLAAQAADAFAVWTGQRPPAGAYARALTG